MHCTGLPIALADELCYLLVAMISQMRRTKDSASAVIVHVVIFIYQISAVVGTSCHKFIIVNQPLCTDKTRHMDNLKGMNH